MSNDQQTARKSRKAFFNQVFSHGSVAAGIIQAVRPNKSIPWDEEEDARRSDKTVGSFVDEYENAVNKLSRS